MAPILNLLILQFLIVYVIDYSGFIEDGLEPLVRRLTGSKVGHIGKPWSCSLCCMTWIGLLYVLFAGLPFWYVAVVAALAALTPITYTAINFVKDFCFKVFEVLYAVFKI